MISQISNSHLLTTGNSISNENNNNSNPESRDTVSETSANNNSVGGYNNNSDLDSFENNNNNNTYSGSGSFNNVFSNAILQPDNALSKQKKASGNSKKGKVLELDIKSLPNNSNNDGSVQHVPCKFYKHGACTAGKECIFSHQKKVEVENQLCKYWQKGNCKFGNKCALSHGPEEDKKRNMVKNKKKKKQEQTKNFDQLKDSFLNLNTTTYNTNNNTTNQYFVDMSQYYSSFDEYNLNSQTVNRFLQTPREYPFNNNINYELGNYSDSNIASNSVSIPSLENKNNISSSNNNNNNYYYANSPNSDTDTIIRRLETNINNLHSLNAKSGIDHSTTLNNYQRNRDFVQHNDNTNTNNKHNKQTETENIDSENLADIYEHDFLPSSLDEILTEEELENRRFKHASSSSKYNTSSSPLVKNIWKLDADIITENKSSKKPIKSHTLEDYYIKNNKGINNNNKHEYTSSLFGGDLNSENSNTSFTSKNIFSKDPQFNMEDLYSRLAMLKYSNTYDLSPILSVQNSPNLSKNTLATQETTIGIGSSSSMSISINCNKEPSLLDSKLNSHQNNNPKNNRISANYDPEQKIFQNEDYQFHLEH